MDEDMKNVIERLRASKKECEEEEYRDGFEAGSFWAKESAEWRDLDRLASEHNDVNFGEGCYEEAGVATYFVSVIDGEVEWSSVKEFWENANGKLFPTNRFVWGFWDGAVKVFNQAERGIA